MDARGSRLSVGTRQPRSRPPAAGARAAMPGLLSLETRFLRVELDNPYAPGLTARDKRAAHPLHKAFRARRRALDNDGE